MFPSDEAALCDVCLRAEAEGAHGGHISILRGEASPKDPRTIARIVLKPAREVVVTVVDARKAPVQAPRYFCWTWDSRSTGAARMSEGWCGCTRRLTPWCTGSSGTSPGLALTTSRGSSVVAALQVG